MSRSSVQKRRVTPLEVALLLGIVGVLGGGAYWVRVVAGQRSARVVSARSFAFGNEASTNVVSEAAVASRVEQILLGERAIGDQEDRWRRLLNPGEEDLRLDVRLTPKEPPVVA